MLVAIQTAIATRTSMKRFNIYLKTSNSFANYPV
jgi:hypothetical protein